MITSYGEKLPFVFTSPRYQYNFLLNSITSLLHHAQVKKKKKTKCLTKPITVQLCNSDQSGDMYSKSAITV